MATGFLLGLGAATALAKRSLGVDNLENQLIASEERLKQAQHALNELSSRAHDLNLKETQLAAFQGQLATQQSTYKQQIDLDAQKRIQDEVSQAKTEYQTALEQAKAEVGEAIAAKEAMQQELTSKMHKVAGKLLTDHKADTDKAKELLGKVNQGVGVERERIALEFQALKETIEEQALKISQKDRLITRLQAPKQFTEASYKADIGNKIQAFLSGRSVILGADRIGKVMYGYAPYYFEAINCDLKQVNEQLEALELHLCLIEKPEAANENGKIKITVKLNDNETPVSKAEVKIVNPPFSKLEQAISESIHVRIVAISGSGKTVLLGNIINYLIQTYLSTYKLSDPKMTNPENWGNLTPDYLSSECLGHLFGLAETCLNRINEAVESFKSGRGMPDFNPEFHIIDELELLYGLSEISSIKTFTPKAFKINVKTMLKVGREHKMKLLFVTQSPLPSDLNMRRNDLENCSSIFLGPQISDALSQTDEDGLLRDVPKELIARLKVEHKIRLAQVEKLQAEQKKVLEKANPNKKIEDEDAIVPEQFIYLFFNPAKPHKTFMGLCPPPNHYAALQNDSSITPKTGGEQRSSAVAVIAETQLQQATAPTAELLTSSADAVASSDVVALPAAGFPCPTCGVVSNSYRVTKLNKSGKVTVNCKNEECSRNTFQQKVI